MQLSSATLIRGMAFLLATMDVATAAGHVGGIGAPRADGGSVAAQCDASSLVQQRRYLLAADTEGMEAEREVPCNSFPRPVCSAGPARRCFNDPTCSSLPPWKRGVGCNAGGVGKNCRFCGHGWLQDCPETCGAVKDADPAEFALLSGDVYNRTALPDEALEKIGWARGPEAFDPHNPRGSFDLARVYTKGCRQGYCDYCMVTFSATNDATDIGQGALPATQKYCGADGIRGGVVQEMRGFFNSSNWTSVTEALSPEKCCRVYASGWSLGGNLATLFAYCANTQEANATDPDKQQFEGVSSNVELVTWGDPRLSAEPLYNGVRGQCFKGARYSLTDRVAESSPPSIKAQLKAIELLARTSELIGDTEEALATWQALVKLQALLLQKQKQEFHALLDTTLHQLDPFVGFVAFSLALQADLPWVPEATAIWAEYLNLYEKEYQFEYDVVPGFGRSTFFPAAEYRPLRHPVGTSRAALAPAPEACNGTATAAPLYNTLQVNLGFLGYVFEVGTYIFTNHFLCCYVAALGGLSVDKCAALFSNAIWAVCPKPTFR